MLLPLLDVPEPDKICGRRAGWRIGIAGVLLPVGRDPKENEMDGRGIVGGRLHCDIGFVAEP